MRRFLVGVLLAAAGVLVTPAAALAHAELVSSDPGYGDRLPSAPAEMRLYFSAPVDLTGARVTLHRRGRKSAAPIHPALASPDRRVVLIPLPRLTDGAHTVVWFFLGNDGHLMGGETPFSVGAAAAPGAAVPSGSAPAAAKPNAEVQSLGPGIAGPVMELETAAAPASATAEKFTIAVATPQALVRLLDYASLAILIGGVFFLARVWAAGTGERRAQRLLWAALVASAVATLLGFGLTAAGLQGVGAHEALRPSVLGTVLGTRYSRIMTFRAVFLGLGFVALTMLTIGRDRAVRSRWWQALAGVAGGGLVVTHALLGHVSNEGLAARVAVFVHVVGVSIWLGGLVFLAAVVLPRRRIEEVRVLLPRFSRLAFTAVTAMVLAGAVMMLRVVPKVTELPQSGYGRILLLKLAFVGLLLVAAQQARAFTERRLVQDSTRLRPLLMSVGVELTLAVVILTSTAVLVGRVPSGEGAPTNAVSTLKGR
jgi:putative copper export protein/methionine-rich copper-binding protein CopC